MGGLGKGFVVFGKTKAEYFMIDFFVIENRKRNGCNAYLPYKIVGEFDIRFVRYFGIIEHLKKGPRGRDDLEAAAFQQVDKGIALLLVKMLKVLPTVLVC
jgi:hypothetical protein